MAASNKLQPLRDTYKLARKVKAISFILCQIVKEQRPIFQ